MSKTTSNTSLETSAAAILVDGVDLVTKIQTINTAISSLGNEDTDLIASINALPTLSANNNFTGNNTFPNNTTLGTNYNSQIISNGSTTLGGNYNTSTRLNGAINIGSGTGAITHDATNHFFKQVPEFYADYTANIISDNQIVNKKYCDTKTTLSVVQSSSYAWSGAHNFVNLPASTQTPTTSTQLVTKAYCDSAFLASNNVYTGTNAFNTTLPTSTIAPVNISDLCNKTYVDTKTNLGEVQSASYAWSGNHHFDALLPTSTKTPTTSTELVTKLYVDGKMFTDLSIARPILFNYHKTENNTTVPNLYAQTVNIIIPNTTTTTTMMLDLKYYYNISNASYNGTYSPLLKASNKVVLLTYNPSKTLNSRLTVTYVTQTNTSNESITAQTGYAFAWTPFTIAENGAQNINILFGVPNSATSLTNVYYNTTKAANPNYRWIFNLGFSAQITGSNNLTGSANGFSGNMYNSNSSNSQTGSCYFGTFTEVIS